MLGKKKKQEPVEPPKEQPVPKVVFENVYEYEQIGRNTRCKVHAIFGEGTVAEFGFIKRAFNKEFLAENGFHWFRPSFNVHELDNYVWLVNTVHGQIIVDDLQVIRYVGQSFWEFVN